MGCLVFIYVSLDEKSFFPTNQHQMQFHCYLCICLRLHSLLIWGHLGASLTLCMSQVFSTSISILIDVKILQLFHRTVHGTHWTVSITTIFMSTYKCSWNLIVIYTLSRTIKKRSLSLVIIGNLFANENLNLLTVESSNITL